MTNNSNRTTVKDEENKTIVNSLDNLYDFLFKALCNDDIFDAIEHAKKLGVSDADISINARRLLENYDDLAKVKNLEDKDIRYLIMSTRNTEFTIKLYETIDKFYRERRSKENFNIFKFENTKEKVLFKLTLSSFYRGGLSRILEEVYPNHIKRISEACNKKQAFEYDKTIQKILEETNNNKDIQKILENTISLLFNDWYGEDVYGKPTPKEISITTTFLGHLGIKKYVMRNYKDFLQSSWSSYNTTEWSDLKNDNSNESSQFSERIINYYLEKKGWTINDKGELISLTNNKPVKLDINFPSAINMSETPFGLWAYRNAFYNIKRLILDEWDQDIFGGKQPKMWKIKQIISETKHPGIMKYALKKYQKELIEYNFYDSLCEDIAIIEIEPENYEHLINLYNTILAHNNIDLDALSEKLEPLVNKQQLN